MPGAHTFDGVDDSICYDTGGATYSAVANVLTFCAWVRFVSGTAGTLQEYFSFSGGTNGSDGIECRKSTSDNIVGGLRNDNNVFSSVEPGTEGNWHTIITQFTSTSTGGRRIYLDTLANTTASGSPQDDNSGLRRLLLGGQMAVAATGLPFDDQYGNCQIANLGICSGAVLTDTQKTNFLENNYSVLSLGTESGQQWLWMPKKLLQFGAGHTLPSGCLGEDSAIQATGGAPVDTGADPATLVYPALPGGIHIVRPAVRRVFEGGFAARVSR